MIGKANKKKKRVEEETSYWLSFSDLMSSLLIIFMLLFIYKAFDYTKALESKENKIKELTSVRSTIIMRLLEEFGEDIKIDKNTGAIKLKSELLFDRDKSELKDGGKKFLTDFMPKYISVLLGEEDIKAHISRIIIEGHTDDDGSYMYNLKLSQDRAFNVVKYIIEDKVNIDYKEDLKSYLSAIGRSEVDLIISDGIVSKSESRRVEIKFRLKDEDVLKAILKEVEIDQE